MVMMEPYVKKWYDHLDEGRLMALCCNRCNNYIFPPVAVCDNCYSTDLSWAEISGEGELVAFSLNIYPDPPFKEMAPYIYGLVKLKEGPSYSGIILGVDTDKEKELFDALPRKVQAEPIQMEGYRSVAFRLMD
jgi:uncharacterized OB-fold protein